MDASLCGSEPVPSRAASASHETAAATSDTTLPAVVDLATTAARYQPGLATELRPTNTLGSILISQLVRHAAKLDFTAEAETATIRIAASSQDAAQRYGC